MTRKRRKASSGCSVKKADMTVVKRWPLLLGNALHPAWFSPLNPSLLSPVAAPAYVCTLTNMQLSLTLPEARVKGAHTPVSSDSLLQPEREVKQQLWSTAKDPHLPNTEQNSTSK